MQHQSVEHRETLDYCRPGVESAECAVAVSRRSDRSIAINVRYPNKLRLEMAVGCGISGLVAVLVNCIAAWWGGWPGFLASAAITVPVLALIFSIVADVSSEHEWNVGADGIRMLRVRSDGNRQKRYLPRSAISDIGIRFRTNGRRGRGTCYLVVRPSRWWHYRRGFFTRLGGNHLGVIADSVREGLGLPRVSWPSGSVIQSTSRPDKA